METENCDASKTVCRHSLITHYLPITIQEKEIIRKSYMKNEVLKYMISIIVK